MPRPKGSKNVASLAAKERIAWAFERVNGTGNTWLLKQAEDNPAIFASLVARCIPVESAVSVSHVLISLGDEMQAAAKRLNSVNAMRDARILEHDDTAHIHQPIENIED